MFAGDATGLIKNIKAKFDTVKDGQWGELDHDTLPAGVLVKRIERDKDDRADYGPAAEFVQYGEFANKAGFRNWPNALKRWNQNDCAVVDPASLCYAGQARDVPGSRNCRGGS